MDMNKAGELLGSLTTKLPPDLQRAVGSLVETLKGGAKP